MRLGLKIRSHLVLAMWIVLLFTAACSSRSEQRRNESCLKQDLYELRTAIDQYTQDKHKSPQELNDLVTSGYLKHIPKDPLTNSDSTWVILKEDVLFSSSQPELGISDVHSGSHRISSEGTPYDSW